MSGYRRLNGSDLQPTTEDIKVAMGALTIPAIPPLSLEASVGVDLRREHREASDGSSATQTGSSIDMEFATIFVATPLGPHLSTFLEFPLFETHAIENDSPTGPGEANNTQGRGPRRAIQFDTESPTFEMGKIQWNSLFPVYMAPADSVNILAGAYQLPTAFSPEANRLSVAPYLIYRRRAIDLLSPTLPDTLLQGDELDRLLRLGEPQLQVALNGVLVPSGQPTDMRKPEALVLTYDAGIGNGSNHDSDPNTQKDFFGRLGVRWYGQTLGIFGYYSPDIYDDAQRADGSIAAAPMVGIFSGRQASNSFSALGPDLTIDLRPFDVPVWLENQVLFDREDDPTGFRKSMSWVGGFSQLYVQPIRQVVAYARYDWLTGDRFNDTGVGGRTGPVRPREWMAVGGVQWFVYENFKVATEYSHREYSNNATQRIQRVIEHFFTVRATVGF